MDPARPSTGSQQIQHGRGGEPRHRLSATVKIQEKVPQTVFKYVEMKKVNQQSGGVYEVLPDTVAYSSVELLSNQECPTYSNITYPKKPSNMLSNATRIPNSVVYSSAKLSVILKLDAE
ncbi:CMRF35-like molecule 8 [Arapaima gigas]